MRSLIEMDLKTFSVFSCSQFRQDERRLQRERVFTSLLIGPSFAHAYEISLQLALIKDYINAK